MSVDVAKPGFASAVASTSNVSRRAHKRSRPAVPADTSLTPSTKAWAKRQAERTKLDAVKATERAMRAEAEEERERKRTALKERRERDADKARIQQAAAKMSAKRLQRFKKRLGRSKKVAH